MEIFNQEDVNRVRLDLGISVNLETINPYRAQFGTSGNAGDWINAVTTYILAMLRDFTGSISYDDFVKLKAEGGDTSPEAKIFVDSMKKVNVHNPGGNPGITDLHGQMLVSVNLIYVQVSKQDPRVEEATTELYVEKKKAEAAEEKAKAIRTVGNATADAFNAIGSSAGGQGAEMFKAKELAGGSIGTLVMGASGVMVSVGAGSAPPPAPPTPPSGSGSPPPGGPSGTPPAGGSPPTGKPKSSGPW